MIITVSNYDEKVGKSFIATELAKRLASSGYETLLMDFGTSYRSCANLLDVKGIEKQDVYEFLTTESDLEELVLDTDTYQLSLLDGSERTLKIYPFRYGRFTSSNPLIKQFKKVRDFECVIVDTLPKDPILSIVHRLSDFVVIPIDGYEASIKAAKRLVSDLQTYKSAGWKGEFGVLLNNINDNFQVESYVDEDLPFMPMQVSMYGRSRNGFSHTDFISAEIMKSIEMDTILEWIFIQQGEYFYAN